MSKIFLSVPNVSTKRMSDGRTLTGYLADLVVAEHGDASSVTRHVPVLLSNRPIWYSGNRCTLTSIIRLAD